MNVLLVSIFKEWWFDPAITYSLTKLGCNVTGYAYRDRCLCPECGVRCKSAIKKRDDELRSLIERLKPDLMLVCKGETIGGHIIKFAQSCGVKVCYYYMDYERDNFTSLCQQKIEAADYCVFTNPAAAHRGAALNPESYVIPQGYNDLTDFPIEGIEQDLDATFIGTMKADRRNWCQYADIQVIEGAYGPLHPQVVARSKINVAFQHGGPGCRPHKILAAGGFLLMQEWKGREQLFEDGVHLVTFSEMWELKSKVEYYLRKPEERLRIAEQGWQHNEEYSTMNWCKRVLELNEQYL